MTYYSGCTKSNYVVNQLWICNDLNRKHKINCFDSLDLGDWFARTSAIGFALKRARQELVGCGPKVTVEGIRYREGTPIVIEITKPEEFQIRNEGYAILTGRLNQENHITWSFNRLTMRKSRIVRFSKSLYPE